MDVCAWRVESGAGSQSSDQRILELSNIVSLKSNIIIYNKNITDISVSFLIKENVELSFLVIHYPTEMKRGKYLGLGIFLLQYFPLVSIYKYCIVYCITVRYE